MMKLISSLIVTILAGVINPAKCELKVANPLKEISGIVLNSETSAPVPYASVSIMGANIGTNADAEGRFSFITGIRFQIP